MALSLWTCLQGKVRWFQGVISECRSTVGEIELSLRGRIQSFMYLTEVTQWRDSHCPYMVEETTRIFESTRTC